MFLEIFRLIWTNRISRIILLSFFTLITGALIIKAHMDIYNFFYTLSKGQLYYDPSTYKRGDYGFSENPRKAEKLFQKGLKKLVKLSAKTYDMEMPENILKDKFNHNASWETFTDDRALELVYMLFHDLELFCMPASEDPAGDVSEKLEKRYTRKRKSADDTLKFAIKNEEFKDYANLLTDIDQDYFFTGVQKKPDSFPLLHLRKQLLRSVCKPAGIPIQLNRALGYMEYASEKEVSKTFQGGDSNLLYELSFESLKKNPAYPILLKENYMESFFFTKSTVEKIKQSFNYYALQQDEFYFENYLKSLLELSSISGVNQNRKIWETLKSMETEKNRSKFSYLYTLAEVSFRARYYDLTREYIDLIKLAHRLEGHDYYKVHRLEFLIDLLRTG